jgi:DNA-binding protein H-NS
MPTYRELVDQIESLKKQAEQLRKAEMAQAISEIRQKMAEHGITLADLRGALGKGAGRRAVRPKYRNEKTGETWSGRGKPPKWLVAAERSGKSRASFLIKD